MRSADLTQRMRWTSSSCTLSRGRVVRDPHRSLLVDPQHEAVSQQPAAALASRSLPRGVVHDGGQARRSQGPPQLPWIGHAGLNDSGVSRQAPGFGKTVVRRWSLEKPERFRRQSSVVSLQAKPGLVGRWKAQNEEGLHVRRMKRDALRKGQDFSRPSSC